MFLIGATSQKRLWNVAIQQLAYGKVMLLTLLLLSTCKNNVWTSYVLDGANKQKSLWTSYVLDVATQQLAYGTYMLVML